MTTHNVCIAFCAGLVLAIPVSAQGADAFRPTSIVGQAHGLSWRNGQLLAHGPDYRARFESNGMVFTPALGRAASRTYPFRVTPESIRRGSDVVWTEDGAATGDPRHDGSTVVYSLASGLTERFAVGPDGVELSYVFDRPVGTAGDLVVRLRVETELRTDERGEGAPGFRFHAEGLGGVRFGGVTGIDARDRRAAGRLSFDGTHLELVLPADFVDSAAYPLVLDPPIGADLKLATTVADDTSPDAAFDDTSGVYLVVWQREFSVNDVQILSQRVNPAGALVGTLAPVRVTPGVSTNPTVCNSNLPNRFLVCWQEGPSVFGPWDLMGACVVASTAGVTAASTIAATTADEIDPDSGSEATGVDDEVLVVWNQRGAGLVVAQVNCGGIAPVVISSSTISSTGSSDRKPAISQSGGLTGNYIIAWERRGFGIRAACVDRNAVVRVPLFVVHNTTLDALEPDVDGDGTDFLVVWQQREHALTSRRDIWGRKLNCSVGISAPSAAQPLAADSGDDEMRPAVGYLGPKYLVAWADELIAPSYEIVATTFQSSSCVACGQFYRLLGGSNSVNLDPQVATRRAAGTPSDEAALVWTDAAWTPPYKGEVWARMFGALGSGGAVVDLGGGCGGGATMSTNGPFALGNSNFSFLLSAPGSAAATGFFSVGLPGTPPIVCGSCTITVPLTVISRPISLGRAAMPVPVPCNTRLLGGTLEVQWWVFDSSSSCSLTPGLSFSNRLQATIGW